MNRIFLVGKIIRSLTKVSTLIFLSFFIIACGQTPDEEVNPGSNKATVTGIILSSSLVKTASWNGNTSKITVSGDEMFGQSEVKVFEHLTNTKRIFLGSATVNSDRSWSLIIPTDSLDHVPCDLYVASNSVYEISDVQSAPTDCGPIAPQGSIDKPVNNIEVLIGSTLNFNGSATDANGDTAFTYLWDFGSYYRRVAGQNTSLKFDRPGIVTVKLLVRDSTGTYDSTPDSLVVTVLDAVINSTPNGSIITPNSNRTINVGESITFLGTSSDADDDVSYLWDFAASGIAKKTTRSPGALTFNKAGQFDVTLTVTDDENMADPTPAKVTVTVNEVIVINRAPNGSIQSPAGASIDVIKGNSLTFKASGTDPDGDTNLNYSWNFGGYRAGMSGKTAVVSFDKVANVTVTLNVRDSEGMLDPTADTISVRVLNQVINAEPNGTITRPTSNQSIQVGDSVRFTSSASDPDGNTLSYHWDFGDSGVLHSALKNPGSLKFNKIGIYNVILTVKDDKGLTDSTPDSIKITVADSNTAPNGAIKSPSSDKTIDAGQALSFSGQGVDADGDVMTYRWDFGTSGIADITTENPGAIIFDKVGTHRITFTVTDSKGLVDPSPGSMIVTVNDVSNGAPNASITTSADKLLIKVGGAINFTSSSTDPDGDAVSYAWDFGLANIPKSTKASPGSVIFDQAGTFIVTLTVTDEHGLADPTPAKVSIDVSNIDTGNGEPNGRITSPVASSISLPVGSTLRLSSRGTDPDGDTDLTYTWDFGSYAPAVSGKNISMTFDEPGQVLVTLNVRDSGQLLDPTPAKLVVSVQSIDQVNQAPESLIRTPSADQTIEAGESISFAGLAIDPEDNAPFNYFWNFDGASPNNTAQNPGYVMFATPGVYRVTLTSTDSFGAADTSPAVRIITVGGSNLSPPESIINSPADDLIINVGDSVRFSGSGTDLDGDSPFEYFWNFDGVAPNEQIASPGDITFTNAGVYQISLRVTDASGAKDPTPANVQVTVTNFDSLNEPPNSIIITPSMDVVIFEGDSLTFRGTGNDPEGDDMNYRWDFGAAAPNALENNPGNIQFTQAGVFNISFTVTDSNGLADATPATIRVVVIGSPSDVAPESTISSPANNLRIDVGDVVNFDGFGTDADGDTPLTYLWNFDGATPHVLGASPGNVTFATPGTYRVRFSVTDATGLTDPTPAERVIIVDAVNTPTGNIAPNGVINSPSPYSVVNVGETLNFTGSGIDSDGDVPLTYRWNFGGVIPNSTAKDPGLVTFTRVGTYRIVLTVTDSMGSSDLSPAERLVSVISNSTLNFTPAATIVSPNTNQEIDVGSVVNFTGAGTDPDNNTPLTYLWDFDGAVPNVVGQSPGNVSFKKAGNYVVTLQVVDSRGAVDPTPATIIISVAEGGGNNGDTSDTSPNWLILNPPSGTLTLNVGDSFTFKGADEGQNGEFKSFAYWNFNGYTLNGVGGSVTKTFDRAGTVIVDYKVKDASGAWVDLFDSVTIIVK